MAKEWTGEEKYFLKKNYKHKGPKFVAEKLGRPYTSVMTMARKLKVRSAKNTKWEEWHIEYLKEYYGILPVATIQLKLKKTYSAILEKAQIYHLSKRQNEPFSPAEIEKLKELYPNRKKTNKQLERIFGRSFEHIRKVANANGLFREHLMAPAEILYIRKNYKIQTKQQMADKLEISHSVVKWFMKKNNLERGNNRAWTKEETDFVKKNYKKMTLAKIAETLNRTEKSLIHYTRKIGLNTNKKNYWTEKELQFLEEHHEDMDYKEISKYIKRTPAAINTKILELYPLPDK